jgi:hypothetical protein
MSSLFDTLNFHYTLERAERLRAERALHSHIVAARRAADRAGGRADATAAVTPLRARFERALSAVAARLAQRLRSPRLDPGI